MAGSFYCSGQLPLMRSAKVGFFSGPYFAQSRNEVLKNPCIFKIYFFNISLAKKTIHKIIFLLKNSVIFFCRRNSVIFLWQKKQSIKCLNVKMGCLLHLFLYLYLLQLSEYHRLRQLADFLFGWRN